MSHGPLGYETSCPHCGGQLDAHVGPAQNAPWLCSECHRGWWCSELSGQARGAYRPRLRDFSRHPGVASDLLVEVASAHGRGHSVHDSMTGLPGVSDALAAYTGGTG